jgi:hypothetical protein
VTEAIYERQAALIAAACEELERRGHAITTASRGLSAGSKIIERIDGLNVPVRLTVERSRQSHKATPTGRLRLLIGDYGRLKQYPEPKGGHTPAGIADRAEEGLRVERLRAEDDRRWRDSVNTARDRASRINAAGLHPQVRAETTSAGGVRLVVYGLQGDRLGQVAFLISEVLRQADAGFPPPVTV